MDQPTFSLSPPPPIYQQISRPLSRPVHLSNTLWALSKVNWDLNATLMLPLSQQHSPLQPPLFFCFFPSLVCFIMFWPSTIKKMVILFSFFSDLINFLTLKISKNCSKSAHMGRAGQYTKTHSWANGIILVMYEAILNSMPFFVLKSIFPGNCKYPF